METNHHPNGSSPESGNDYKPSPVKSTWETNKALFKGLLIGLLILIMMIPSGIILSLVQERQSRQQEVIDEVNSKWAGEQVITGPVLYIPYYDKITKDEKGANELKSLLIMPELLDVNGRLQPEIRHRSIYDVMLYSSDLKLKGHFNMKPFASLHLDSSQVIWSEVKVLVGINDFRGLEEEAKLHWRNQDLPMEVSAAKNFENGTGLGTTVSFDMQDQPFEINMKLKGSSLLYFTPVGKTTNVELNSTWQNPAFDGKYLPNEPAEISQEGFRASWKILHVSRDYPQYWTSDRYYSLANSSFGVKLINPADGYAKTKRSVKYSLLFIALTFTVFFFMEIVQKKMIHPLQYILVGMALCVFYFLLLSLTEYLGFNPAYLIASAATIVLIGSYTWSIFKAGKIALGFIMSLTALYFYIFIIIQLQDFSLLVGSVGLFVVLSIIMYYSRKIDWYRLGDK